MLRTKFFSLATLALGLTTQAALYSYSSGTINQALPDGSLSGFSASYTFSGIDTYVQNVAVKLDLSGGYNGDLYAYLSYDGKLVPLLNRVGVGTESSFGFSTGGMQVTLADSGQENIHDVANPVSGATYRPDGRAISPLSTSSAFDANPGTSFADLIGSNPTGTWTLFFADLSGGKQSTLVSWQLDVTAVPEPANTALAIFAGLVFIRALAAPKLLKLLHAYRRP